MMFGKGLLIGLAFLGLLMPAGAAGATDWDACNEALQKLQNASSGAGFLGHETARKQRQLQETQSLYNKYTGIKSRYDEITAEYQQLISGMKNALAELQAAMFNVEIACYASTPLRARQYTPITGEKLRHDMCLKLKQYTKGMQPADQLELCQRARFPGDCEKCLALE